MTGPTILLLHEDGGVRQIWKHRLLEAGFSAIESTSASTTLRDLPAHAASLLICGDSPGDGAWNFNLMQQVRDLYPRMPIIFVATQGSEELAVRALRAGVSDYIA